MSKKRNNNEDLVNCIEPSKKRRKRNIEDDCDEYYLINKVLIKDIRPAVFNDYKKNLKAILYGKINVTDLVNIILNYIKKEKKFQKGEWVHLQGTHTRGVIVSAYKFHNVYRIHIPSSSDGPDGEGLVSEDNLWIA